MASNAMKGTQSFQDIIKAYLETMAENDALFAVRSEERRVGKEC